MILSISFNSNQILLNELLKCFQKAESDEESKKDSDENDEDKGINWNESGSEHSEEDHPLNSDDPMVRRKYWLLSWRDRKNPKLEERKPLDDKEGEKPESKPQTQHVKNPGHNII